MKNDNKNKREKGMEKLKNAGTEVCVKSPAKVDKSGAGAN